MNKQIVALINLTGLSENQSKLLLEDVMEHPLLSYSISAFKSIAAVTEVYVYTSREEPGNVAKNYGARTVITHDRLNNTEIVSHLSEGSKYSSVLAVNPFLPLLDHEDLLNICSEILDRQIPYADCNNIDERAGGYGLSLAPGFTYSLTKQKSVLVSDEFDLWVAEALMERDVCKNHPVRLILPYCVETAGDPVNPHMLFTSPYRCFNGQLLQELSSDYFVTFAYNAPRSKVLELLPDQEVWYTGIPTYKIDAELISAGSHLKVMATPSTGTNHIDVRCALENGIEVMSLKDSPALENIHASSEFSFSLLLAMIKKIPLSFDKARHGIWREYDELFRSIELNHKTIGLIGYGRIGKKMARFATSFEMKVLAYDPLKKINDSWVKQVERDDLLKHSDIVSLHYHLSEETKGSFTGEDFKKMKRGAYFLNTSRGELVDEHAMIEALKSGKLNAAAVDVITDEANPNKWNHPVISYARTHDNLLIAPHIAGLTVDSEIKAATDILDQIKSYYKSSTGIAR